MVNVKILLKNNFYTLKKIQKTIDDFSEYAKISILNNDFELEFNISDEYDSENIIDEFRNYLLCSEKENLIIKKKECNTCSCESKKEDNELSQNFRINENKYNYNFYREEKFNEDKYLITTETRDWIFVNKKQYDIFKNKDFDNEKEFLEELTNKSFLIKNDDTSKIIKKYQRQNSHLFKGTNLHIIVVTLRCNLKCSYCHASAVPKCREDYDLDEKTAKSTIDIIFESPSEQINIEFQGGEPLLNFDIIKFCTEYAIKKNKIAQKDLQFSLVSNFVNMTDEIFEFCFKNNIGLCTSIDGPKELHNKNRQEYDKTIKWVEKIQNKFREENIKDTNKSYKLNSLITVSKESLKYPKEIVDTYIKYGLESLFAKSLNPLGFAKDNENIYYSAEEYLEFWEKYVDYIIEKSSQGYKISEYYVKILLMKLEGIIDPNYTDLMSPCGAVRSQMLYNYNGEVFSCDEGRMTKDDIFKIGNVKTDNYIKLTTNPTACSIITSSINDTQICDKCVFKPFCGICPVLNYSAENSVIANIHKNNRCKILKAQFKYILNILENEKNKSEIIKSWIN